MTGLHKLDRPEISQVIFYPRFEPRNTPPPGATDLDIQVDQGISIGCRLFTADIKAPIILFFHGNGEVVQDYDDIGAHYINQGINFLIADYRGYGWSSGKPSAVSLINDAGKIFKKAAQWLQDNMYTGRIFIMGRSLGSACAIDLAWQYQDDIAGLIIESGFAETVPLMKTLGIDPSSLNITEADCFNNLSKIKTVTIPTLILHGQQDTLIPLRHAEQLHAISGARSKELQIVPGADHNSLIAVAGHLYFESIRRFIDKITGATGWRERRKRFRQQQ